MATMMKLTLVDPGAPPLSINPHHVVSVKPRRALKPNQATQGVQLVNTWEGATVQLSTGAHHNVVEDHDTIIERIDVANGSGFTPGLAVRQDKEQEKAASDLITGAIAQDQVVNLPQELATAPEEPKKAVPKKATPKPPAGASESDKKDEETA